VLHALLKDWDTQYRLAAGVGHFDLAVAVNFPRRFRNKGEIVAGIESLFARRGQIGQKHTHFVARKCIALPEIEEVPVHVRLVGFGLFINIDSRKVRSKFLSKR
jgi:hypothetical protein